MPEFKDVYTLQDLKDWDAVTDGLERPPRLAVFGDPVAHSKSPQMMNPALEACGIEASYVRIHVSPSEFEEALKLLPTLGFIGTNVTIPHKGAALKAVDDVDDLAQKLGAVNTVVVAEDNSLLGFNSDGPGFLRAVHKDFMVDVCDLRVMILGAGGGAGRAVAVQCALENCERLVLVNRTEDKARELAEEVKEYMSDERVTGPVDRLEVVPWEKSALQHQMDHVDLIVNATSIGMKATDPELIPESLIQPHHMIFDMIYSSGRTKIIRAALANGARATNGLSMLLHQGAISFEHWFDREAPIDVMRKGLEEA